MNDLTLSVAYSETALLVDWDVPCGSELVRSLMREPGLEPCQPKPWRFCLTDNDGQAVAIPDLVQRDFTRRGSRAQNGR